MYSFFSYKNIFIWNANWQTNGSYSYIVTCKIFFFWYFLISKQSSKVKPSLQEKQLIRLTTKIIFNLSNENWNFGKLVYEVEIFPILKSFLMKLLVILTNTNFWYFIMKWATILNIFVIQKTYIVDPWTKCRSGALALHTVKNLLITYNWPSESTVPLYPKLQPTTDYMVLQLLTIEKKLNSAIRTCAVQKDKLYFPNNQSTEWPKHTEIKD